MDSVAIRKKVYACTAARIDHLRENPESGSTKAALASMRRGAGKIPGELPELWGMLFDGFPEELMSMSGEPNQAEWAVYAALTLFALHQQSKSLSEECMSREGQTMGSAVRRLSPAESGDDFDRVRRKFNIAATSADIRELTHHLRGLVQLLRDADIPLDYPRLAEDLYLWQFPEGMRNVRLRWGQDFYRLPKTEERAETASAKTDALADKQNESISMI